MKLVSYALVLSVLLLTSCKDEDDCISVDYGTSFSIEEDTEYCFSDGTVLEVVSLNNEYCPCFAVCVWEGEATADFKWTLADGTEIDYVQHTAETVVNDTLPDGLIVTSDKESVVFERDCTVSDPSPDVASFTIVVDR